MTQDTETGQETIKRQIFELFEKLSPDAQANLIDELIAIADIVEEYDD